MISRLQRRNSAMPGKLGTQSSGTDSDVDVISGSGSASDRGGDDDEDALSESSESESEDDTEHPNVVWTGYGKKTPVLIFRAESLVGKKGEPKNIGERYHMAYKMVKTECKLVRSILASHGFHEVHPNSSDFNIMWTGSHLKPYTLRGLQEFQKVNHFPRSYEITRKDRLFKNVQRMQQTKGFKNFDFLPSSFIVPGEFQDFCSAYLKDKGPWIVKPVASSRGRGIFLCNHPEQVPLDETMIVSKYIHNPLLIDGFKFDIRLYVAVTSYDPLTVFLYEEGLTRFATVKYDKSVRSIRNQCMHLTNYSVNKKNQDYVKNDDPDVEDYGNKWSLGALLRYLRSQGKDTTAMMMRIEDVIIKTLISAEMPIATACKMFMPFRGNCFEVYGFDILVDEGLRPWVLEVNLSPSLACDSPLDLKIKSNMISDLFSLTGFMCHDPMVRRTQQSKRNQEVLGGRSISRAQSALSRPNSAIYNRLEKNDRKWKTKRGRPQSANSKMTYTQARANMMGSGHSSGLNSEEIRIVRRAKEENLRRGGWVRVFPTPDSWELYGSYLQSSSTHNFMLYSQLFPDRAKNLSSKPSNAPHISGMTRSKSIHSAQHPQLQMAQFDDLMAHALQRTLQYERKLSSLGQRNRREKPMAKRRPPDGAGSAPSSSMTSVPSASGAYRGSLVQGMVDENNTPPSSAEPEQKQTPPKPTAVSSNPAISNNTSKPPPEGPTRSSSSLPPRSVERKVESQPAAAARVNRSSMPTVTSKPITDKPRMNVVTMLEKGHTMSKVQARFAFATYLTRVQQRLIAETNSNEADDVETANEQMDLVLRFLKRAAGNLQQPFKVVVPSRKLALADRRRILAKQLADFVHIYNKETDQLRQRTQLEKKHLRRPPSFSKSDGLNEEKFNHFVNAASEGELEDVLTTYTKLNKSASIFLGSNSKSTYSTSLHSNNSGSDNHLARRQYSSEDLSKGSHNDAPHSEQANKDAALVPVNGTMMSYPSAVLIYSSKTGVSSRQRPLSAVSSRHTVTQGRMRPMSASMARVRQERERPDGAESQLQTYDEEAINAALQRLAVRQQQRQYKSTNVLASSQGPAVEKSNAAPGNSIHTRQRTQSWGGSTKESFSSMSNLSVQTNVDHYDTVKGSKHLQGDQNCSKNHAQSESRGSKASRPDSYKHRSANDTFNNFVEDAFYDTEAVAAYNQVTGVRPKSSEYRPSRGSQQYQIALKQQKEQSQDNRVSEQSRAKHQVMIAQAHAAHKSSHTDLDGNVEESESKILVPKPPPKPAGDKKPASAHRLARTNKGKLDNSVSGNFYHNVKYDSSTGTTHVLNNSAGV